jgi:hypothetical protein
MWAMSLISMPCVGKRLSGRKREEMYVEGGCRISSERESERKLEEKKSEREKKREDPTLAWRLYR